RTSPDDLAAAEHVYVSQLGEENVDETTQTAIVTLYAKFLWQTKKDVERAREIFKTGVGKFDSRFYFSTYLNFEMDQPGDDYEKRVSNVFEQVRYSGLSEVIKHDFEQGYLDFVMEFGSSAARYNQLEADIRAPSVYVVESRKRVAAEQAEEERAKRPRQEDVAMGSSIEGSGEGASMGEQAVSPTVADPAAAGAGTYGQQPHWGSHAAPYGYAPA
ncbi:hypothetical protein BGZ65_000056, partial [Modicella reniformis]